MSRNKQPPFWEERLRGPKPVSELVIVQSPSLTVDDPQFQAKVESVYAQITALGPDLVESGSHYYLTNRLGSGVSRP